MNSPASSDNQAEFQQQLATVVITRLENCSQLHSVERLSGGASQETYRLSVQMNEQQVTLAMRRSAGGEIKEPEPCAPGLKTEARLMQAARACGVPEPDIYWVLQPEDGLGEGFIMQWLEGETLGARINRSPEFASLRPRLARECGRVLARIHSIDLRATGLEPCLTKVTPAEFLQQTYEIYKALDCPQPMIDYTARWLLDHLPQGEDYTLVHNDFRNGNLMVNSREVVAVLDWELAHIGDPVRDLGWLCTNSWRFGGDAVVGGFGELEDLVGGYEEASGKNVNLDHLHFWQVFGSLWWAVVSLGMVDQYRNGPDKSVERPAIGRRSSECQVDCVNLLIPGSVELIDVSPTDTTDMPSAEELLVSVRDFLHNDVMAACSGRENFLARVAGNSLDIVLREQKFGPQTQAFELESLHAVLGCDGQLCTLRRRLANAISDGTLPLDSDALQRHLRNSAVHQLAIDQPHYSGLAQALAFSSDGEPG